MKYQEPSLVFEAIHNRGERLIDGWLNRGRDTLICTGDTVILTFLWNTFHERENF